MAKSRKKKADTGNSAQRSSKVGRQSPLHNDKVNEGDVMRAMIKMDNSAKTILLDFEDICDYNREESTMMDSLLKVKGNTTQQKKKKGRVC
jgi:hypothetical protein